MARYDVVADDTAAHWTVDGHVVMTADGEQAHGEWWMEDGRAGEYEDDGDTMTLYRRLVSSRRTWAETASTCALAVATAVRDSSPLVRRALQ